MVGVALVYLGIAWAVPLLHKHDCSAAPGSKTTGNSFPSDAPCPACKFLVNSCSNQVSCEPTPVLIPSKTPPELNRHSRVILTSPCEGAILLRGPPAVSLP